MELIFNETTKKYEIKDFNQAVADCKKFIEDNALLNVVIQNDDDKKAVKKARTLVRKKNDEVATLRKNLNELVMGNFNAQAKELEGLLKEADSSLKSKLDDYENKLAKPTKFTIIISSYDEKIINEIKEFAISKGNVEVK